MLEAECGFESDDSRTGQVELELSGPTLSIRVERVGAFGLGGSKKHLPKSKCCDALVDTGADKSCIDIALARDLGLEICDTQTVHGVHGPQQTNYYVALVTIQHLDYSKRLNLAGLPLAKSGFPQDFLIGRDILKWFVMVYEGDTGKVTIQAR